MCDKGATDNNDISSHGPQSYANKGCGACQLCCPTMRPMCCNTCSPPCCPPPCSPPTCSQPSCCSSPSSSPWSSPPQRVPSSASIPCCNPCVECCPPTGFNCNTRGLCPTACCGAKCNQIVTCCPPPTIQPIQIWGCTPHGCCNQGKNDGDAKPRGGGGFCS